MNIRHLPVLMVAGLVILSGCPKKPPTDVEETGAITLRFQFPRGRVLNYAAKSDTAMRFTFPFIAEPQQIRAEADMNILEEVLQEPIGGYALIEQRIKDSHLVLYRGDKVVYDSSRPNDFQAEPQFQDMMNFNDAVLKFEISPTGEMRRSEGFEGISSFAGPGSISQVFQNAQPVFPERPVRKGETWESRREIPILPGKGMRGTIVITDREKLADVRQNGDYREAVIEMTRDTVIEIEVMDQKNGKFKPMIKGKGTSIFHFNLDIDRGVVVKTDGRISLTTASMLIGQPGMDNLTIDLEGSITITLIE